MKNILIFFLTCFVAAHSIGAELAPGKSAKQQDVKKLLVLTGSGELGMQMIGTYKRMLPDVPQTFWNDFIKEVNANDLVELIAPIYDKHFSHEEIKGLIKFYSSDLGRKFVAEQPQILQESIAVGQLWGKQLGEKVAKKLKEKGYNQTL